MSDYLPPDRLARPALGDLDVATAPSPGRGLALDLTGRVDPSLIGAVGQSYTPTWTASGTAPALGNGTLVGRFIQIGKLVFATVNFTVGSTSTFGTGNYRFSLPATAATSPNIPVGIAYGLDSSSSFVAIAMVLIEGAGVLSVHSTAAWPSGADAPFGQLSPWTWATSDVIRLSLTYEAA